MLTPRGENNRSEDLIRFGRAGGSTRPGLVYLCDWLPPDFGAVGQYSLGFARDYAREGRHVVLVGLSSNGASTETEPCGRGRLTIVRVPAPACERTDWRKRLLWTLRANLRLTRAAHRAGGSAEDVLFTGSPPFMLYFVLVANLLWRKRLIYRITDFHPECLMAMLPRVPAPLRLFYRLTCFLRRRVHQFQVLGLDQRRRLEAIGIPGERVVLKRDPAPVVVTGGERPLAMPKDVLGYAVLLYSGNWGIAHDVDTFLEGYLHHHRHGSGQVALWLNAVGVGAEAVGAALSRAGVPFARTQPVPLEDLSRLLVTPDAHLITLKDEFVGYVMPSKVYGCIESNRPILFVGSPHSDVDLLCRETKSVHFYGQVRVGDVDGVAAALESIADRCSPTVQRRAG